MSLPLEVPTIIDEASNTRIYDFIRTRTQAVVSTVGLDSRPEAALVNIAVAPNLEIVFETSDKTRKYINLETNMNVALVIGWGSNETLQYEGTAEKLEGRAIEIARQIYAAAFPQKLSHQYWSNNHYFQIRPTWIRLSSYYAPRKIEGCEFGIREMAMPRHAWWQRLARVQKLHQQR